MSAVAEQSPLNSTPTPAARISARLPGGFDIDFEGDFETQDNVEGTEDDVMQSDTPGLSGAPLDNSLEHEQSSHDDTSSVNLPPYDDGYGAGAINNTVLEEQEMNRKLAEFESSFVPELSHLSVGQTTDPFIPHGLSTQDPTHASMSVGRHYTTHSTSVFPDNHAENGLHFDGRSPKTPPGLYKTPAPEVQDHHQQQSQRSSSLDVTSDMPNTSALEQMSSSPTAARTVSRVQSMATLGGYETADEHDFAESPSKKAPRHVDDPDATPRKTNGLGSSQTTASTAFRVASTGSDSEAPGRLKRRPKYLNSRSASARLSYDSMASSTTETSDATLGADFALQSGGAAPDSRMQRKPRMTLSRSASLGSIVSGVSNMSDDETQSKKPATGAPELSVLTEESPISGKMSPNTAIVTPKPSTANFIIPTDTVVANHVRDLEVPGTFARQYRQLNSVISPEKPISMAAMTPGTKKGLTLKEHRSTVEKLGKENFDLKMKIHFLDQALQRRSEDGVKEMITENVQLKSDRMRLEKDNHSLRKQVRELQKKLDVQGSRDSPNADQGYATDEDRSPTVEEEVVVLRERIETSELLIEKLRSENIAKESEKRRLAEMVRSLGDTRTAGSDVGSREERDMWKDMLESETTAREQSEDENRRLREEIAKLRQDTFGGRPKKTRMGGSVISMSSSVEGSTLLKAETAEVERLRHEVSELQKMISAQASTLTSRNKEKERLYQEIEDLKLNGRLGGLRSIAGDSILERSASRARSNSRASNGTRFSRLSESEREQFEVRIGELRDEVSQLKLEKQELRDQFDQAMSELDASDQQAQDDLNEFNAVLAEQKAEQENLLRELEEQHASFEQLRNEAQEEIDGLGDELDAKVDECAKLEEELKNQSESVQALQNEVRSASEGLARLEQDSQQSLSRYHNVKSELEDANRELEKLEKSLADANAKVERLTVQQESSHNEIAFLREEQDGDKIKIGDLESLLKKTHLNLDSEREKARDFERRLHDERSQRETVSNQEKQDVQRLINDLNREATGVKDELRRIRKAFSTKEVEAASHRDRLDELEGGLRHILGEPNSNRATLLSAVNKMRRELEQATLDLDHTSKRLDEHQNLLTNRDTLLESSSLEYRKMADLLERERQGRRQDKHSFEQSLKSHQQAARALSTNNARITELEQARQAHRKQLSLLETQFKDQLAERNQILLAIWKKLSALCGPDWAHNNSLINGNLPSQEVIGNMLFWPGFSRNLLLAAKQIEGTFATLKDKIKKVERDLRKDYHSIQQQFELRNKKLEHIEEAWEKMKLKQQEIDAGLSFDQPAIHGSRPSTSRGDSVQKLKGENQRLRTELQMLQSQQLNSAHLRAHNRSVSRQSGFSGMMSHDGAASVEAFNTNLGGGIPARRSSMGQGHSRNEELMRQHSRGVPEHYHDHQASQYNLGAGDGHAQPQEISPERRHESIRSNVAMPSRPYLEPQLPANGKLTRQPIRNSTGVSYARPPSSIATAVSNGAVSETATITSQNFQGNQAQWIHRLRELERRLKHEREQRLVDRSGMRTRLEEKEAVNEELRKELERERVRRSWDAPDAENDDAEGAAAYEELVGVPSLNNRIIEVEGSPVRTSSRRGQA